MTTLEDVDIIRNPPGWNLNSSMNVNNRASNTTSLTSTVAVDSDRHNGQSGNEDLPPSYESTIPPNHIGWSTNLTTTIPFPMPQKTGQNNDERPTLFMYPTMNIYSPRPLHPIGKSQLSIESPYQESPELTILPSRIPNPTSDRLAPVATSPTRPQFERANENVRDLAVKPDNESSCKAGPIMIVLLCIACLVFVVIKLSQKK